MTLYDASAAVRRFRNVLLKDDFYRAACIWVSLTMMSYVPSMRAVTAWEEQRRLLKYELGQRCVGWCGGGPGLGH